MDVSLSKHFLKISISLTLVLFLIYLETDLNAIIKIRSYMAAKNNVVGIMEFEKVFNYKAKIGDPQEFNTGSINPEHVETFILEKSMIDLSI